MKILKYFLISSFLWMNLASLTYANDKIVFGITPFKSPKAMHDMHNPLVQYLGKRLKKNVILIVVKSYEVLSQKIQSRKIDAGFFSPSAYVEAIDSGKGLKYIATTKTNFHGNIRSFYKSVIIVHKDSPFHTLQDLKGKRFAFTSKRSASGYIFPNFLLKESGIDSKTFFSEVFWLKRHSKVTSALTMKSVDAGATFDSHFHNEIKKLGNVIRIIAESQPIPSSAIAAGSHLSDSVCKELQDALIELKSDSPALQATFRSGVGIGGYSIQNDQYYDIIRKLKKQ
jgi:phosphonate transport system substrate-binding protein